VIVGRAFPGHMEILELSCVILDVEATAAAFKRSMSTERLHFYFQEMKFR
jgi:predicted HAD superfamily phosphohydrolase YqeG